VAIFEASITIGRPIEEVFAVVSEPANDHRWSSAVIEAGFTTPGPAGVGSIAHYGNRFLGRRIDYDWRIVEFEPNRRFVAKSIGAPVPTRATLTFEPAKGGTRFTVGYDGESAFARMVWRLTGWYGKRAWEQAMRTLKGLMETNQL
jgi:uncharacterized protein YndB with AHSA1/START domain